MNPFDEAWGLLKIEVGPDRPWHGSGEMCAVGGCVKPATDIAVRMIKGEMVEVPACKEHATVVGGEP